MKEVHVDNLVPGVRYRIHNNSGNNKVGTFINHNSFGPIFTDLIALYPVTRQPKPGAVSARTHTFYVSGKTLQRENDEKQAIKRVLNGDVGLDGTPGSQKLGLPGLGTEYVRGGRRTRKHIRKRLSRRV